MMMNQGQGRENLVLQKTEACAFVAGVEPHELLPSSVTVQGNNSITNTNSNRILATTIFHHNHNHNGSSSSEPGQILPGDDDDNLFQPHQEKEQEEEVGLLATFGNVLRKRRMARMRRRSSPTLMHLHFHTNNTTAAAAAAAAAATNTAVFGSFSSVQPALNLGTRVVEDMPKCMLELEQCFGHSACYAIDHARLRFLFQKELKNSDVSSLRRMVLPKKAAEACLPPLESKEGIVITMDDLDGVHVWSFKYRIVYAGYRSGRLGQPTSADYVGLSNHAGRLVN
ncbi:hypothetical protein PIB30_046468 [Stylosanthes scabra]|uniref:TF-B3 domain-containing protein n=1 Tax=Stylosanthes scabra TaxID=79078 RepID=A0ABU6SHZ2_9FABA|nr:hypothetical protein [Stylosanthes scabra]